MVPDGHKDFLARPVGSTHTSIARPIGGIRNPIASQSEPFKLAGAVLLLPCHACRSTDTSIARPIGAIHTSITRPIGSAFISIARPIGAIHTSIARPIRAIQPDSWWNFSLAFSCCCPLLVSRSPSISNTCNADRSRHRFICCASSTQLNSMCLHSVPMQN